MNTNPSAFASGAVVASRQPLWMRASKKTAGWIPGFLYVFFVFVAMKYFIADVRTNAFDLGPYSISWAEILLLTSTLVAMFELLRVSKPGIDSTGEALRMLLACALFIVLFTLATTGISPQLAMFATSEFLIMTVISVGQVVLAFMINARTLKRTIDYTGGDHY